MSPYLAYFLGLITLIVIFLPFWLLAQNNLEVAKIYNNIFCSQLPAGI